MASLSSIRSACAASEILPTSSKARSASADEDTVMNRLSKPLSELAANYDAIVVGSGYGGGVAARGWRAWASGSRSWSAARAVPGEYPDTPTRRIGQTSRSTASRRARRAHRLLRLARQRGHERAGRLRPRRHLADQRQRRARGRPARCSTMPAWPAGIATDISLEGYPARRADADAARPIRRTDYPDAQQARRPWRRAAQALGGALQRPPINVTFADRL